MAKMRQSLVPVLLLATVALSSSNVLPVMSINQETEPLRINSRQNDNIFSNRFQDSSVLNDIFYKVSIGTPLSDQLPKVRKLPEAKYAEFDNNHDEDDFNIINKGETYNGEGFRKEQWHNYPRQLDRLYEYLYEHHNTDKRNPDPDNPDRPSEDYSDETIPKILNRIKDSRANELLIYSNDDTPNVYDTVVRNTDPFLILKIRLACLNNKLSKTDSTNVMNPTLFGETNTNERDDESLFTNEINPSMNAAKIKREDLRVKNAVPEIPADGKIAVKKRLFSLWSRLQSLNHKGHELQHRRHLHAYYGLPDGDGSGNGVLTAETRATLMRPPGSPLRWG